MIYIIEWLVDRKKVKPDWDSKLNEVQNRIRKALELREVPWIKEYRLLPSDHGKLTVPFIYFCISCLPVYSFSCKLWKVSASFRVFPQGRFDWQNANWNFYFFLFWSITADGKFSIYFANIKIVLNHLLIWVCLFFKNSSGVKL